MESPLTTPHRTNTMQERQQQRQQQQCQAALCGAWRAATMLQQWKGCWGL
jgi:hypothetical protein